MPIREGASGFFIVGRRKYVVSIFFCLHDPICPLSYQEGSLYSNPVFPRVPDNLQRQFGHHLTETPRWATGQVSPSHGHGSHYLGILQSSPIHSFIHSPNSLTRSTTTTTPPPTTGPLYVIQILHTAFTLLLQTGQSSTCRAHPSQAATCPQSKNSASISSS